MKNIKNIMIVAAMILIAAACSDDFLTKRPLGSVDRESVKSRSGIEVLTIGAYSALNPQHANWGANPNNWVYGSIAGGDAYKGTDPGDQPDINAIERFAALDNNGYLNEKWNWAYNGIFRCNDAISIINEITIGGDIDADFIKLKRAELRFLRAFYYFELMRMFTPKVPWLTEKVIEQHINNPIVANDFDISDSVKADFQFAVDNLPATWDEVGRINSWGAKAFLAKFYLYQHKYTEAKALFDDVIANGTTTKGLKYGLQNSFDMNFNVKYENSLESVFAVQNDIGDGSRKHGNPGYSLAYPYGSDAPGGCCGFYQPTTSLVNSFQVDPVSYLPLLNTFNNTDLKNDDGFAADSVYNPDLTTPVDPRLDWTVGRRGNPYLDWGFNPGASWVRNQSYGGPFLPIKNVYRKVDPNESNDWWAPGSALNIDLMRFADVLLMAAECEIEVGDVDKARTYVNMIRERAGKSTAWDDFAAAAFKTTTTQAEFDAINDTSYHDINVGQYIVREDKGSQVYTLIKIDDGKKVAANKSKKTWNVYGKPNYHVGLYTTPWSDKESAKAAVRFERKLELAMEGHRFFDLVRWGKDIAISEMSSFINKEKNRHSQFTGANFSDNDLTFPIPLTQIELSGGIIVQTNVKSN